MPFHPGPDPYHGVIYDWNLVDAFHDFENKQVALLDETLRDGLQSPSVTNPPKEEKLELVHLMDSLGIGTADVGLPASSDRAKEDCVYLARAIDRERLKIKPACAARTTVSDVQAVVDVAEKSGTQVEVMCFIGSSAIRMLAEQWDIDFMLRQSRDAIRLARQNGLDVTFVTEDTSRSRPDVLYKLFTNAIEAGAQRLCLCDTTGHATPDGIRVLFRYVKDLLRAMNVDIHLDWHGHNDRGLALANSLWAIQWGADRIHGTALGVGERCGNTPMDQLILNLRLLGSIKEDRDLTRLLDYCRKASEYLKFPIPPNYPLAGRDAFRTQTGVHAAAIRKALEKGDQWLADRVYSGVPAGMFGRRQEICVGPMSGASNARMVLESMGIEPTDENVRRVLEKAKAMDRILEPSEVLDAVYGGEREAGAQGDGKGSP